MSTTTDINIAAAVRRITRVILLVAAALLMSYPLLWLISSSFKPESVIFSDAGLDFNHFTLRNYVEAWNELGVPFGAFMLNSAVICLLAIVGNLFPALSLRMPSASQFISLINEGCGSG